MREVQQVAPIVTGKDALVVWDAASVRDQLDVREDRRAPIRSSGAAARRLLGLGGEELPLVGDSSKRVQASILELQAGPRHQILDRARHEDLAGSSAAHDA